MKKTTNRKLAKPMKAWCVIDREGPLVPCVLAVNKPSDAWILTGERIARVEIREIAR